MDYRVLLSFQRITLKALNWCCGQVCEMKRSHEGEGDGDGDGDGMC